MPGLVYVVDDDVSFRTAIERRLKIAGYDVETYASAATLLNDLPDFEGPRCILLDVEMPGLTGPQLQKHLAEVGSILPIIFVSGHADAPTMVRAIKSGAEDFLTKPVSSEELIDAIEHAMTHYVSMRTRQIKIDGLRALVATLTPREREVFGLLVSGKLNKEIGAELGTTERTVKAHRHGLMEKMQVRSLAQLLLIAEHLGMFNSEGN